MTPKGSLARMSCLVLLLDTSLVSFVLGGHDVCDGGGGGSRRRSRRKEMKRKNTVK